MFSTPKGNGSVADSFKVLELMFVVIDVDTWDMPLELIILFNFLCQINFRLDLLILLDLNLMLPFPHIFIVLKASGLSCVILPLPSLISLKTCTH